MSASLLANKRPMDYDGKHQPSIAMVSTMTIPTMRLRAVIFCTNASLLALAAVGCSGAYTGVEPFADTFHEDAGVRDYYVGMNLNFALDPAAPHLPPAHSYDPDVR